MLAALEQMESVVICALVAKTKGLNEQGMSAYCYTGNIIFRVRTLTDSIVKDIMTIQEIIELEKSDL